MTEPCLPRFVRRAALPLSLCFLVAGAGDAFAIGSGTAATASSANPLAQLPPEVNFFVTTLGFGGIAGWCVGFTLKKFAKMAALVVGMIFMSIQYLAYNNYVTVDWEKIRQTVPASGMEQLWAGLMSVFTYNLPFAGAFAAGLLMGFRRG
ncbi:MAG TPA: FUN14 domain-containing protein [Candidatus Ozemobacteraceae bacterium]